MALQYRWFLHLGTRFTSRRTLHVTNCQCVLNNDQRGIKSYNEKQMTQPPLDINVLNETLIRNLDTSRLAKASTLLKIFDAVKTNEDLEIAENALLARGINLPRVSMPIAVTKACLRVGLPQRALDIAVQKRKYGIFASVKVYNVIMDYYMSQNNPKGILRTFKQLLNEELVPNPVSITLAVLAHMLQNTDKDYDEALKLSKYCLEMFPGHKHQTRPILTLLKFSLQKSDRQRVIDILQILNTNKPRKKFEINWYVRGYAAVQDYDNILSMLEELCNSEISSPNVSEGVINMIDQQLESNEGIDEWDKKMDKWKTLKIKLRDMNKIDLELYVAQSEKEEHNLSSDEEEDTVVQSSVNQRWPEDGEPVCVICGRYGAYIVDQTDRDVCSIECKEIHLSKLNKRPLAECIDDEIKSKKFKNNEQLKQLYKELQLEVKGVNIPKPVTSISDLSLNKQLSDNLHEAGYHTLTPVQMQVIPAVISRRNILVASSTGSGKTLSFLLPLVHLMITFPAVPTVLILAPTRELCIQIEEQAKLLMKGIPDMRTALLVGGVPLANQLHRLKSDIKLLVGTPARIQDILTNHANSINLTSLQVLVLDEVDSLLQMGFEKQIENITKHLPVQKQTLLFSATVPPHITKLANQMLHNPLLITVGMSNVPCDIKHTVLWVEEDQKKKQLFTFLNDPDTFCPPAVVFVCSRKGTLLLAEAIDKMCDIPTIALHGEMLQERRSAILKGFLDGRYQVIVSTGVLARGLDLNNVKQVFNFDLPSSIDEFVHQVGRASRLGSEGWSVSFINNENKDIFKEFVKLMNDLKVELPVQLTQSKYLKIQQKKKKKFNCYTNYKDKNSLMSLLQRSS